MVNTDGTPTDGASRRLRPSRQAVDQRFGDETLLIHLKSDRILSLNRTGARLWELLCAGHDRAGIERGLRQEFDVGETEVTQAVGHLLASLGDEGLIEADGRER